MRWEYVFITCGYSAGLWRPQFINGNQVANWQLGPAIHDYANQLGDEGWELANTTFVALHSGEQSYRLIFKRQKA